MNPPVICDEVPPALAASPLLGAGGFTVTALLSARARERLLREALSSHREHGTSARLEQGRDEDVFRGNPARFLESAPGGDGLAALYRAPAVYGLLQRLTGIPWVPSGDAATYSYYRRPGHFLGIHRDIEECDLAVIACLHDAGTEADASGGQLVLWPRRSAEPLAAIRADPDPGRVTLRLRPGEAAVLLGGLVPHEVTPVGPGHVRIVTPMCFKPA